MKSRILLTGANGYIGKRLLPVLVEQGHEIICLVRDKNRLVLNKNLLGKVQIIEADLLDPESLKKMIPDFHVAYYLVHSMTTSTSKFYEMEKQAAENFVDFLNTKSCRQIIYLGGISTDVKLSRHLESRKNVREILNSAQAALTSLGAGIIVGSGSASFEIIRDIVEKLPFMLAPRWLNTRTQPIAVRDAIKFLTGVMLNPDCYNQHFDIGGPEVMTYKEMLLQYARVRGYKRWIITLPVLTPRLSSYWLNLVTSTPYNLASTLVDSMTTEVISSDDRLQQMLGIKTTDYETAIRRAFDKIEQHMVLSSWKDALASSMDESKISHYIEVPVNGCYQDRRKIEIGHNIDRVITNFMSIGGKNGWYYGNWLWKFRGFIDSAIGGVGLRRGRTNPFTLMPGDALDFWRVIDVNPASGRLLLYAEMKLPGEAWLEFRISRESGQNYLIQTATFRPRGIFARMYWYGALPFHLLIFSGMAHRVATIKMLPVN
ncbi:MAG: SDR family oxidoreductase [Bacteroidales bacterium]|nr:SDR family oxidoreductase [Bacteroidales bacterium]